MHPQTICFEPQTNNVLDHNHLDFYLQGDLKILLYLNEETLQQGIFMPFQNFANMPGPLRGRDSP
jgi:hypothetical protein